MLIADSGKSVGNNNKGMGMIGLLIALLVIVGLTYYTMNRQIASHANSQKQIAVKVESQGIQPTTPIHLTQPSETAQAIGVQVEKLGDEHAKSVDCAASGDATGCRLDSAK